MVLAAVGQLCSTSNITSNLAQCRVLVQKAVAAGAKVLFLPEASDYIASSAEQSYSLAQSEERASFVSSLQIDAKEHSIHINVGIHEVASETRLKNSLIWIDDKGTITQNYHKVHLFDVDIKDGPVLKESASVQPGQQIPIPFETPIGRVGLSICFDLRFPEISLALRRQNAEIITYPSAFTVPTGKAHWEPLLRARAIETQSYVIAAAQAGPHNDKRRSYGHSAIISPWGEVVAKLGDEHQEPQIATADIDLDLVAKIRREMPLLRRNDLYPEI
ncbi:Carbon-nitrogen hydrolase [Penicillium cf. griseofulvum]|uniref:Carbon-nitrogen hydrolase n=1 Tax=Penicillium cf. griseofulvum TaxID=2972120 RepID=A0A9W9MRB1_9EURO|nr:Carbon-nitrogen hydrolase [Penicillium cf. griseofulvum]KAJ5440951.1 Carbon-nitrogen hydrolase [Penicillium cf. griseofulvum]KAJ5448996.1 Carbon-nitrogen hydrolase [Penicillium cf. griseofulvum]